jgi:Fur family transcriptional regulator, ferric uptake regulator
LQLSRKYKRNQNGMTDMTGQSPAGSSLLDELTARGVRITAQRRALVEVIQQTREHLDAASLLEQARRREPGVNRATVYRTIELLKKMRLIDELDLMHLNGEKHYYEAKSRGDHIHLACFDCGCIQEFVSPSFDRLKREIARETGFELRVTRLEVGGRCANCCAGGKEKQLKAGE